MIYEHVLPGQQIIHVELGRGAERQIRVYFSQCHERLTEEHAEQNFRTSPTHRNPSLPSFPDRHARCWNVLNFGFGSGQRPGMQRVTFGLDTALLFTCRQIYHEAKYTFSSTNTFSFRCLSALRAFMDSAAHGAAASNLAIRKIHLSIDINSRLDEYDWNRALPLMVQKLPGVNNVCVSTYQKLNRCRHTDALYGIERPFTDPATGKNLFLRGILALRKLRLSRLVVIVPESGVEGWIPVEEIATRWTHAQRVEWARYVKAAVLGSV